MKTICHTVTLTNKQDTRVDKYLSEHISLLSRNQLKSRCNSLLVNGKKVKLSKMVKDGDKIEIVIAEPVQPKITANPIDFSILYENEDVIVINKPQGLVVHPGAGNWDKTLVNGLMYHCNRLREQFPEERIRPGIVHRLDKDTSGVIIVAKTPPGHEFLAAQFKTHKVRKVYIAIIKGIPECVKKGQQKGTIKTVLARDPRHRKRFTWKVSQGKTALTYYKVLKTLPKERASLVVLKPVTGRTHQLRVHMKYLGSPIIGDVIYAKKPENHPLMLHAYSLRICLPGKDEPSLFKAPIPDRFKSFLTVSNQD